MLASFIFLILSIPVGAYLASQRQIIKSSAYDRTVTNPLPTLSPLTDLTRVSTRSALLEEPTPEPTPTSAVSFGPTLSLKLILEGRPEGKQAAKVFVGIAEGSPTSNPKYLLSFTIDLPDSGLFSGLSLAGLTAGNTYTAYIKGPAQIATASAFLMLPSETKLSSGNAITLLTGDLNDDNVINSADLALANAVYGTTPGSPNWNPNVDFNLDGVINTRDLSYIFKNFTKTGESGVWQSTPATKSGGLTPQGSNSGYWLWVPQGF